ncbi:MAG: bifunctional diaminohydroxyphosphoribosylaminopyrimidine deaminase/5-amino-6-(5-phosphoribosylamino)uracil reductase RibD [Elusimicrobiota bacterium]|nr:bifunctional diaminohydroxyphosphoribosylaminopyrimidine deaminase/5-amino-6-(5-phosphoribosylamino)uracil reductase RibD [Elusimicrobiota bacterium]
MKEKSIDENYMRAAIKLAWKGKNDVYPNPKVGCVIVKDKKIVGRGWHKFFGGVHAEAEALIDAGKLAKGADLYVTLEPCANYGKRPPCVKAIAEAGIKRVFFAVKDPNAPESAKFLRANGVKVYGGVCKKEAEILLKDFFNHIKIKPLITIKAAMTLDGKIASFEYDSKWISCKKSRDFVHKMRTQYDAVLIGSNTAKKDNPFLSAHNKGKNPIRIVVDFNLKVPKNYHLFDGSAPTIIVYDEKIKNIEVEYAEKEKIILASVNAEAAKKDFKIIKDKLISFGIKTVLIEGGGEIFSWALFSGCADDFYFFIAPKIIGGKNAISVVGGRGVEKIKDAVKIKHMKISKIGDDYLARGKCSRE